MSSACTIGHIMDDLLAVFNGEMGSKRRMDTASWRNPAHMDAIRIYVYTHVRRYIVHKSYEFSAVGNT